MRVWESGVRMVCGGIVGRLPGVLLCIELVFVSFFFSLFNGVLQARLSPRRVELSREGVDGSSAVLLLWVAFSEGNYVF